MVGNSVAAHGIRYQFAEALGSSTVPATLKEKFVGASTSTLQQVAVALLKSEAMQHIHL
jgi:hypothetical protein